MSFYVEGHEPEANTIRPLELHDLAWAMRLEDEAFVNQDRWEPIDYMNFLEDGGSALVACHYGVPVGILWYGPEDQETTCDLIGLAVSQEYRNNGFATRLIKAALKLADDQGFDRATLQVRTDNPAQHLYRRLGFQDVRVEDDYYSDGAPCIHMVQNLR